MRRPERGFSLIEIVLAVGIISFALVAIIGLFPVAIGAATESQRETQAALLASTLFSDLESQPGKDAALYRKSSEDGGLERIPMNLATRTVAYLGFDSDGAQIPRELSAAAFTSGTSEAAYLARIETAPLESQEGLARVSVRIDAPGSAPESRRSSYQFVCYLNQDEDVSPPVAE